MSKESPKFYGPGELPEHLANQGWFIGDGARRFAYPPSVKSLFLNAKNLNENFMYTVTDMSVGLEIRDTNLGRTAWGKILHPYMVGSDGVEMIKEEARIQANLEHPNVVTIYDVDELVFGNLRLPVLVSSYIDGVDCGKMVMSKSEVANAVDGVANALDYVHEKGWVHRDVKPSNIMINRDRVVKLTDFGLSVRQYTLKERKESDLIVGTLRYAAPEMLVLIGDRSSWQYRLANKIGGLEGSMRHRTAWTTGKTSDVYCLGATAYQMLSNKEACQNRFGGRKILTIDGMTLPHVNEKQKMTWIKDVSDEVNMILERAMAFYPEERYQSAGQFAREFGKALRRG